MLGVLSALFLFPQQSVMYRLLLLAAFVLMSNVWIATIFLSGMKQYRAIVLLYLVGYAAVYALARFG